MKNGFISIWFAAAMVVLAACASDDDGDLSPSNADRNWYVVEPSDDPVDQLRYEVYKSYGVPIFYSDTIGMEVRGNSLSGEPLVHYEIIDVNYWITSWTQGGLIYSLNHKYLSGGGKSEIQAGVELMRDYVLPEIKMSVCPMSFLLADTIIYNSSDVRMRHIHHTLYAMTTTVVGHLNEIAGMTTAEKKQLAAYVLAQVYAYKINQSEVTLNAFEPFFELAVNDAGQPWHGKVVGYSGNYGSTALPTNDWLNKGFLRYNSQQMIYLTMLNGAKNEDMSTIDDHLAGYTCPSQLQDLYEYAAAVLGMDEADFKAKYADYPLVISRYDAFKPLFTAYLATLE